jgi:hemerythrin
MFEWKPEYSVQMPEIDAQHKRLFALAAELYRAMTQGKAATVLEESLAALIDYTRDHFATEERFMNKYHYPEAAQHKAQHDQLTTEVLDLQRRFQAGEHTLSASLIMFLQNWLVQHIAKSDQQYSAYIRGKQAA